ncbi:nicotinate-nicotinamide nucleotide adenylyltransferase [Candidatus Poribacteria bacterium]|nr:nicotinate-nicotinamide nucleotide adenylyltransferase [Candidatus Poribacteria bacterium]MYH81204.1 nicotinate-nicotinamide nucleotide adenylyltransferase [Candidatus Poribacteria bacterium]MYK94352.1 nicotinate-nicotinamide nucleotide adenylyltransferase [Candidatus Poribacteria bacterium]
MANSLLDLLIQKCASHPDYGRYTELFNRLDPSSLPQIELVHRAAPPILKRGKKLGIFSGSFNPLTLAHTRMVEDTVAKYQLDELLLLLAKANVDKGVFGLPLAARLLTVKKYAESRQAFSVGVSSHGRYIDKVSALKSIFPPDTEFHFIVGYDTLVRIFDTKYYTNFHTELQELFVSARFIVANRAEADIKTIASFMAQPEIRQYTSYVSSILLPDVYAYMSSTQVRELLARGEAIEHLVPPSILAMLDLCRSNNEKARPR